jgi:hypothetical protein
MIGTTISTMSKVLSVVVNLAALVVVITGIGMTEILL